MSGSFEPQGSVETFHVSSVLVGLAMSSQFGQCTFSFWVPLSFRVCVLFLVVICAFNGHGSRRNHRGFLAQ